MCKTRNITSKKHFFIKLSILWLVPLESPEGTLEVPDVRTFRGSSGNVSGKSRAGWVIILEMASLDTLFLYLAGQQTWLCF